MPSRACVACRVGTINSRRRSGSARMPRMFTRCFLPMALLPFCERLGFPFPEQKRERAVILMDPPSLTGSKVAGLVGPSLVRGKRQQIVLHQDQIAQNECHTAVAFAERMDGQKLVHHL